MTLRAWPVKIALGGAVAALLLGAQGVLEQNLNPYVQQIIILAGINIILAVSLTLINGITGQFSLGHAGFMAVGAYAAAAFTFYGGPHVAGRFQSAALGHGFVFVVALLLSMLAAGLAGFLVGLPSLRLRGDYLAIVTLGFGEIIRVLLQTIKEVGGATGMTGLPLLTNFTWVYGLAALCVLCVRNLSESTFGHSMRAVREDEVAAEAVGVNTTRIKVLAFVLSSMWAGVAGALLAHYNQGVQPNTFTFVKSVEIVVMVVLGGLGSITGAALTAVLLKILEEVLRSVSGAFWVGYGLVALTAVLSLPRYRTALHSSAAGWLLWLRWPLLSALALTALLFWARTPSGAERLQGNVSALRFVIYALILIVLMLLRPQGLLGRGELNWNALRRRSAPPAPPAATPETEVAGERAEPVDEGVRGTL